MASLRAATLNNSCVTDTVMLSSSFAACVTLPPVPSILETAVTVLDYDPLGNCSVHQGFSHAGTLVAFRTFCARVTKLHALLVGERRYDVTALWAAPLHSPGISDAVLYCVNTIACVSFPAVSTCLQTGVTIFNGPQRCRNRSVLQGFAHARSPCAFRYFGAKL